MGIIRSIRIFLLPPHRRRWALTGAGVLLVLCVYSWMNAASSSSSSHGGERSHSDFDEVQNDWARGSLLDPHALKPHDRENTVEWSTLDVSKWETQSRRGHVWIVASEYVGLGKYGGIGTANYEMAKILSRKGGHNVTILYLPKMARSTEAFIRKQQEEYGIRVVPLENGNMPIFASGQAQVSHRVFEQLRLASEDPKQRVDVVHFADFMGYAYYSLLAKHQGWAFPHTQFVVSMHGVSSWAWLLSGNYYEDKTQVETSFFELKSLELSPVTVAATGYMVDYLGSRGIKLKRPTFNIQNCISAPSAFDGNPSELISELVFYGRLERRKGIDLFLDAVQLLFKRNDSIAAHMVKQVTFLGRDLEVPERGSMKNWITRKWKTTPELAPVKLVFKDSYGRDEAIEYLRGAKVLAVIPSLNENSPYTVFECLVNRIRFIASRVGGIPELVHAEDRSRVLFNPLVRSLLAHLTRTLESSAKDSEFIPVWARVAISPAETAERWLAFHQQMIFEAREQSSASKLSWHLWRPKVSVCITHYERPALLLQAIDSIRRQTYTNIQVVVVDDKSSQPTREILNEKVQPVLKRMGGELILLEENSYLGAARNRAAAVMRGEYFLFLDDDDLIKPHSITKLMSIVEHTGAEVLTSHFHGFASLQNPLDAFAAKEIGLTTYAKEGYTLFVGSSVSMGLIGNYIGGANIFITREVFQRLNGFTEFREAGCEDWELLVRAELSGAHHELVPDAMLLVRQTPGSMAKTMERFLCTYRALVPVLNEVGRRLPGAEDFLLLAKGLMRKSEQGTVKQNRLASSVEDFSDVQGASGWSYHFLKTDNLDGAGSSLPAYFFSGSWIGVDSTLDIPFVASDAQHPWIDGFTPYSAVRRWTSSVNGPISIKFSYRKHTDECGDGVTIRIRKDKEEIWTAHCQDTAARDISLDSIQVIAGTVLDFVVDAGVTDHCDTLIMPISIVMREKELLAGLSRDELRRMSGSSVLAHSSADFGTAGWRYYFVKEADPERNELPVVYHEGEATWRWKDSPQSWPMVRREDVHPYGRKGQDAVCAVQSYELSSAERVFVTIDAKQPNCEGANCGDGVHVTLTRNKDDVLWEGDVFRESKQVSSEILNLRAGERIIVSTCPNQSDISDLLKIVIRLKYAEAAESEEPSASSSSSSREN